MSVNIMINKVNYSIAVSYRNRNSSVFLERFSHCLDLNDPYTITITGDFHIHFDKNTYEKNKLKELIENNGIEQLINEYTRIYKVSSSIID